MTLAFFGYFLLIIWSLGWFLFWLWAVRNDLRLVRPGPRTDLFAVVRAYLRPTVQNTVVILALWGWLPAAVALAYWLAS